ncbi:uncharacterized protein PG986_003685 [Apiospora aurea]|uniref:Uncharacterized protein n=1 Tax=Apiospora aurea TaxID=335848 RepID=A0ABR1QSK6_9PEZI
MATDNLRQLEALMNRLERKRAASQRPADISARTPKTLSTTLNAADKIERHLRADGHRIWGFVVYRCTYTSDTAWDLCIERIHASVRKSMDIYNGHDMLREGCFRLTVISDASTLDGASTQIVRRQFKEWCARMLHEEQGSQEEIQTRQQQASPWDRGWPVRYGFCIQIDEASMRSIISDEDEPWVNIIKGDWKPREVARQQQQQLTGSGWTMEIPGGRNEDEGEFTDDEGDREYPPVEGCTEEDVGWMKVRLVGLMTGLYTNLRDPDYWDVPYTRPPDIVPMY